MVVKRNVLNVEDTEPEKLRDPSQTVLVPDSVLVERDVLNIEDAVQGKRNDLRQTVPVPEKVLNVEDITNLKACETRGPKADSSSARKSCNRQ